MYFNMPTRLFQEDGCIEKHAAELCALGTKALIVTGKKSSRINGALEDVTNALKQKGRQYAIFDETEENPSVETVMGAAALGRSFGADFVIGIGGGSPLDAAKAAALMVYNSDKGADFLYQNVSAGALPVAAVPTTCGTGSEVTAISVLTVHEKRTKASIPHRIFPEIALIDGKYLKKAPLSLIRNTAVDAYGHLIESWLNSKADDYSRMCAEKGLRVWAECREALASGSVSGTESRLMTASAMAGLAISLTGTTVPHGLSYRITYELGIPHGKAVGMFIGGYLRQAPRAYREFLLELSGFESAEEYDDFFRSVCGTADIPAHVLELTVKDLLANTAKLKSASYSIDEQTLWNIALQHC